MTTSTSEHSRTIDQWFAGYAADHRNPVNQAIHVVCVPLIVWSLVAMLWAVPPPGTLFRPGFWAGLAMLAMTLHIYRASRPLGLGMAAMFLLFGLTAQALYGALGAKPLAWLGLFVFIGAWLGQFLGHRIEGRRPSFLTDLHYLLVGPAWVLAKLYRKLGWHW